LPVAISRNEREKEKRPTRKKEEREKTTGMQKQGMVHALFPSL